MATTTMPMLDWAAFDAHLIAAAEHYEKTAPAVADWVDDLYRRMRDHDQVQTVLYVEILAALQLFGPETWEHPNYAQNRIYKLLSRLGRDTTGMADF